MGNDGVGEEYVCAMCGGTFQKGVADSEAMTEANGYWPDLKKEDAAIICDDCYQGIKPEEHPVEYGKSVLDDAFVELMREKIIRSILYGK